MIKPIQIGKAFRLYMQYPEEVDYFCYDEKPDLAWLKRAERNVFKQECEKYAINADKDFRRIAREMSARLQKELLLKDIGTSKVSIATSTWQWHFRFWQKGRKKRKKGKPTHLAGVWVTTDDGHAKAFPWVWVKGGRKQERKLRDILKRPKPTSGIWENFGPGSIELAVIVLEAGESDDVIVDKIMKPFYNIEKAQWRKIVSLG